MAEKEGLTNFFEEFLKKDPLFKNKEALQLRYTPKIILHRQNEINAVSGILAPALRMERPSNIFLYGKPGTGKTLIVKYVTENLLAVAKKNKISLSPFYINCKMKRVADTEYRLAAELAKGLGEKVPPTGLATKEVYDILVKAIDCKKQIVLLILDEIDQLVLKAGDEILYTLTRMNADLQKSQVSIIGISNDSSFMNYTDPRIKSSLSEEEVLFPPYNAYQLLEILKQRASLAFNENVIEEGVLEKCAAYAGREHGDARRAIELLRVAGELAERNNSETIPIRYLDEAQDKIEKDKVVELINMQPKQSKLALYSVFKKCFNSQTPIFTGDIYECYKDLCFTIKLRPLTQRRVSDLIAELDMMGIINTKVISKGRYGRTRQIGVAINKDQVPVVHNLLKEGLGL